MADLYEPLAYAASDPMTQTKFEYDKVLASVVAKNAPSFFQAFNSQYNDDVAKQIFLVLANDPVAKSNANYRETAELFLDWMAMRTNEADYDTSMTYSEYDASPNKQYSLSKGGLERQEAVREYNLARAMQENGPHAAPGAGFSDAMLSGIGAFFSDDMEKLAQARTSWRPNQNEARAEEALYWWQQGQQENPDSPVWATGPGGAKYPEDSFATFEGVINTLARADNPIGYYAHLGENIRTGPLQRTLHGIGKFGYDALTGRPVTGEEYVPLAYDAITSYADLIPQQQIAQITQRKTPLRPDDPQKAADMARMGDIYERSSEFSQGSAKAYSPQFFEALGMGKRYMTPTEDNIYGVVTSIPADPLTILGGGASFATAMSKGSKPMRAFGKALSTMSDPQEFAEEGLFSAVPMMNAQAQDQKADPYQFSDQVYLDTSMGPVYIKADDPRYQDVYQQRLRDERDRRQQMKKSLWGSQ